MPKRHFTIFGLQISLHMEVTIKLDQRKKEAKALLAYLKSLPFVEIGIENQRYNDETEQVIRDAKNGIGVSKAKNTGDLFRKLEA